MTVLLSALTFCQRLSMCHCPLILGAVIEEIAEERKKTVGWVGLGVGGKPKNTIQTIPRPKDE